MASDVSLHLEKRTRADLSDTYAKQKADGDLVDDTEFKAIKGMNGHPEPARDYE